MHIGPQYGIILHAVFCTQWEQYVRRWSSAGERPAICRRELFHDACRGRRENG